MAFIRERPRKDGTIAHVVQWVEPETGKQTTRTLATRQDARELADFLNANGNSFALAAQAASRLRSSSPTVDAVVTAHITQLTNVTADTRQDYARAQARHFTPVLGPIPVDTLTRADVTAWINDLDRSTKTKRNVHAVLSAALSSAVRDGVVGSNVAKGIRIGGGTGTSREAVFLTREEVEAIAAQMLDPAQGLLVRLLAGTGLRWSEATALEVRDITITAPGGQRRGQVSVTKAWKNDPGGGLLLGPPKTRRARRTVTLPGALAAELEQHVEGRHPSERLFVNTVGGGGPSPTAPGTGPGGSRPSTRSRLMAPCGRGRGSTTCGTRTRPGSSPPGCP